MIAETRALILNGATAFGLGCFIVSSSATAQISNLEVASALNPVVHSVVNGGYWSQGDREGFLRAIVIAGGTEHVSHTLFLQWVSTESTTGKQVIAATISIDEISANSSEGKLIVLKRDENADFGTFRATIIVTGTRSQSENKYLLTSDDHIRSYKLVAAQ